MKPMSVEIYCREIAVQHQLDADFKEYKFILIKNDIIYV